MTWPMTTVGEVCEIRGGGTPSKAVDRFWNGSIPWVSPKDVKDEVIIDSIDHITSAAVANSATSLIPRNCVLVVVRSGILARIVPVAITGCDLTINQDLKALCPKDKIDARFLYYLLQMKMAELLSMVSRGATVHRLVTEQLRSVRFALPPLPEQRRIVGILDAAFAGIATAKANTEKNLQNARAIFESHAESLFVNPGADWVQKTIAQCFKVRSGDFLPAKAMVETGKFNVYGGNGIAGKHDQTNLSGENIIIGRVGAKCGNVRLVKGRLWVTDNAFFVSEYFCDFDLGFLVRELERKHLRNTAHQAAQPVISYSSIKDVELVFPASKVEQERIADKLNALEEDTEHLESVYRRKLEALEALKKSLLHQAFTGELTTPEQLQERVA